MTLIEVVRDIEKFDDQGTIYATEPWSESSIAVIIPEPQSTNVLPKEALEIDAKYFLEVFIVQDFLRDWVCSLNARSTLHEKCARLIQYAINDA